MAKLTTYYVDYDRKLLDAVTHAAARWDGNERNGLILQGWAGAYIIARSLRHSTFRA